MRHIPNILPKIYEIAPIWMRNIFSTGYGVIKSYKERNKKFYKILKFLNESQWWDKKRIEEYQNNNIKKLINHCAKNVPYYGNKFAEYGIIASQIQNKDDLKKIPLLNKEDIRKEYKDIFAYGYHEKNTHKEETGGTTGKPLKVFMNEEVYLYQKAYQHLHLIEGGFDPKKDWLGIIAGYKIIPYKRNTPPFWITSYSTNKIHFSSYHLNKENARFYLEKINKNKIKFLKGYTSSIALLAKFAKDLNISVNIKSVFIGSEPLTEKFKKYIENGFHCKIFNRYGQGEAIVSAQNCKKSDQLHISSEVSSINFEKIKQTNYFKIVPTSLINYAFPIIRYDLGDLTDMIVHDCNCGREHLKINPVKIRTQDFIVTPEYKMIPPPSLTLVYKGINGIINFQIHQQKLDLIIVNIVKDKSFNKNYEDIIIENLHEVIGRQIRIEIKYKNSISRTKSGKFRFVISDISKEFI